MHLYGKIVCGVGVESSVLCDVCRSSAVLFVSWCRTGVQQVHITALLLVS